MNESLLSEEIVLALGTAISNAISREQFVMVLGAANLAEEMCSRSTVQTTIVATLNGIVESSDLDNPVASVVKLIDLTETYILKNKPNGEDDARNIRNILLPVIGSDNSATSLAHASKLAFQSGGFFPLGTVSIGDELGAGGFGTVYSARLAHIENEFAIKIFDPSSFNVDQEAVKKRFYMEANILFNMHHPYIMKTFGVGEYRGSPYILMERFCGGTVREWQNVIQDPEDIMQHILRFAEGLEHAHSKNIVHRDINNRNLMVSNTDARVLDFGVAALTDGVRLTRTGAEIASDNFCAPERDDDLSKVDPRCDIYSLGAVWFWWLTGRYTKGANFESNLDPTLRPEYRSVVMKCLDVIDDRYQSMGELSAAIRGIQSKPQGSPYSLTEKEKTIVKKMYGLIFEQRKFRTSDFLDNSHCGGGGGGGGRGGWGGESATDEDRTSTTTMSLKKLIGHGLITMFEALGEHGESFTEFSLTTAGEEWMEEYMSGDS